MNVTIQPATPDDGRTLSNLMQLYCYDFSELIDVQMSEEGIFATGSLDAYWTDDWRHPFLIRVESQLGGFALVHERSRLTGAAGTFDMAEFFVLRKFRRRGVGGLAAFAAFDRFRGDWEVRERSTNPAATAFWRRAIGSYTRGNYKEVLWNDGTWQGPVQFFSSLRAPLPTE
jgi:predicted acetyltransferase